jgi:hypothetical protein
VAFGLWLWSGLHPHQTRRLTVALFFVYLTVSLYKAVRGDTTCGCFGDASTSPWLIATIDTFVIVALCRWRPNDSTETEARRWLPRPIFVYVAPVLLLVGVGFTTAAIFSRPAKIAEDGLIRGQGVVLLEPETWVGKRLPILPYVKTDEDLSKGTWVLILVHPNCPKCEAVLPGYGQMAREWAERGLLSRVAIIEIPTQRSPIESPASAPLSGACKLGRMAAEREWFAQTPVRITVQEGTVVEATAL